MARYAALLLLVLLGCHRDSPNAPKERPTAQKPTAQVIDSTDGSVASGAPEPGLVPANDSLFAGWPKPVVALVVTGQQMGYIEPCGCTGLENQKGGLARRHTFIKQLADERGWTVVPLDVGSQVKGFGKQQEVKFTHAVQGLRAMDYRTITLGEGDLRLTPGELLAAMARADGTASDFVSSNVAVLARDLQPTFTVIEAGGKRIGVTAVLSEKFEHRLRGDELVHQPPLEALKKAGEELQAKARDFRVLLAHAPLDEARKLAQQVPIFDLVVASGETSLPSSELETVEGTKTRLMQVGLKAMYVGVVGIFDDPKTPLRYQSVPLDSRFADSPDMLKLLADYQEQLKELGLEELGVKTQPHPSGRKFVGSDKCGECHTKAYEKWSQTTHAHATDSLVSPPNSRGSIARHYDPECLSCHVTGWEPQLFYPFDSGYLSLEKTPRLQHNGCENCHGPGSAHVAAESGEGDTSDATIAKLREALRLPIAGGIAERKCIECHDVDNSPDFHKAGAFEKYWKDVEHVGKD
ncbi:MAG TPA: multiheme c-type cytochrome [Pirellulaceae bacterium]|nr:multiheme c-type cytochrome [Pirellulaceae bacterium]